MSKKKAAIGVGGVAGVLAGTAAAVATPKRRTHVQRTLRVWRLTARRGVHLGVMKVRGRGADEKRRAELEEQFVIRSAEDVASVLGGMKGAIMKAGQMFSFIADGLPPEAAAALATLQADVAPMSPNLARRVIREELGADPEDVFLDWTETPVAAASIGQVHRAVLKDGRVVAVKVQYPGVDKAISSDLDNAQLLYGMFSQFALPSLDVKAMIDEVRARMVEELDYRIELKSQQEFAVYYEGHPFIKIPIAVPEFSTRRVLVSEWVEGLRWKDFLETADSATKNKAAEVLMRFAQGSVYYHGMFNGDPHPGNYRFHEDGTITFLDFGLVKRWTQQEIDELRPVLDAVLAQDAETLLKLMVMLNTVPSDHGLDGAKVLDYVTTPYVPFLSPTFKYSREWMASALKKVLDFDGTYRQILDQIDLPTSYVILDRLVWGLGALFGHLEAEAPWGALLDEYRHGASPSTLLGEQEAAWRAARAAF
jgi:predicted unusual protein kinase regulating ubiquinone biosynthesis (AarF/ABC1/UbiB family)